MPVSSVVTPAWRRFVQALSRGLFLLMFAAPATAGEGGSTYFAHGAQTVYAAFLPGPGHTQFYGYTQFYDGGSLRDAQGERIPGIQVQAFALAPRVMHTFEKSLWGFKVSAGAFAVLLHVGVQTPQGEQFNNGPNGYGLEPIYLTRSFGNLHVMLGTVLYAPWGSYDADSAANSTLNRYGGALNSALTWTPSPRWDLSLNLGHEFKGRNRETEYRDGAQSGATFGIGHRPFADTRWDLGVSGYYTVQVEDDHQAGKVVEDRRLRKLAVGPKLGFWVTPATAVFLQWHKEFEVRNAARGEAAWLMFAFPLGA
jgi:hypothetical protein